MKFSFMHKSHKSQRVSRAPKWTIPKFKIGKKERFRFYCDANGILEAVLYAPCGYKLVDDTPVILRARLVRGLFRKKPVDPTGYDEKVLLPSGDGFARVRFFYKGVAEKGRRYWWEIQVVGDAEVFLIGTHYAQFWRR